MPYFINTDIISSLLNLRLVDPGSTLIHVGAFRILTVNLMLNTMYRTLCWMKISIDCRFTVSQQKGLVKVLYRTTAVWRRSRRNGLNKTN